MVFTHPYFLISIKSLVGKKIPPLMLRTTICRHFGRRHHACFKLKYPSCVVFINGYQWLGLKCVKIEKKTQAFQPKAMKNHQENQFQPVSTRKNIPKSHPIPRPPHGHPSHGGAARRCSKAPRGHSRSSPDAWTIWRSKTPPKELQGWDDLPHMFMVISW